MAEPSPQEQITRLASGYWHTQAIYVAAKLGIADELKDGPKSAEVLATATGANPHALYRLLRALASIGIFTEDDLRDFFEDNGVKGEDFDRVYRSNEVDTRVKQALVTARGARVTGVPTVIVNGKYMTSGSLTGSFENLLSVIDQLIARERKPVAAVE